MQILWLPGTALDKVKCTPAVHILQGVKGLEKGSLAEKAILLFEAPGFGFAYLSYHCTGVEADEWCLMGELMLSHRFVLEVEEVDKTH